MFRSNCFQFAHCLGQVNRNDLSLLETRHFTEFSLLDHINYFDSHSGTKNTVESGGGTSTLEVTENQVSYLYLIHTDIFQSFFSLEDTFEVIGKGFTHSDTGTQLDMAKVIGLG